MTCIDLDRGNDLEACVDVKLPPATHEVCANIAYTCMIPTFFMIHFFHDKCWVFVEERFLKIAADSRDFICNRWKIPFRIINVMPMDKNGDEYSDDTKFTQNQWNRIIEANPENDGIDPDHVLQGKAADPHEPDNIPKYYMWRTTTKLGGKLRELHPVVTEKHRLFIDKSYNDFKKKRASRSSGSDDRYWFEFSDSDFDYTDCHRKPSKHNNNKEEKKAVIDVDMEDLTPNAKRRKACQDNHEFCDLPECRTPVAEFDYTKTWQDEE